MLTHAIRVCTSRVSLLFLLVAHFLSGQVLVKSTPFNTYIFERRAIATGETEPYLSLHFSHEWRLSLLEGKNDLLHSAWGKEHLRNGRLKFHPEIVASAFLRGGNLNRNGLYVDAAPVVTVTARYASFLLGKVSLLSWMRFEKHSVVSTKSVRDFSYDFSWQKEVGRSMFPGNDSVWVEYSLGDGGLLLTYPKGEISFSKSNPIWGSGYSGQLWLSDKAPSFVFVTFRHRFSDKWSFSYLHGTLNSTFRDSTHMDLYPLGTGLPMVRKYIVAHRLDFSVRPNARLGFGESVIYGGRSVEMAYALPFLFYWTAQHDLSDSDNLQMFLDFEIIKKRVCRLYGSVYLDEWDFVDTFNPKESRNWAAYQIGLTYSLPVLEDFGPLVRVEATHLTPYVYVHKSTLNTFQHHGHDLGFWSGPNSDNVFLSVEAEPWEGWWLQLYGQRTRRGEVGPETVEMQYHHQKVPFLHRTYEGGPETRTLFGLRGEISSFSSIRVAFDLYWDRWLQRFESRKGTRTRSQKLDGMFQLSVGL